MAQKHPKPGSDQIKGRLNKLLADCKSASNTPTLADVAEFLSVERSAPYQWGKRSRPSPRTAVGLALFEVCKGIRDRLSSEREDDLVKRSREWLGDCGYLNDATDKEPDARALLKSWFHEWSLPMWTDKLELSREETYDRSLVALAKSYDDIYRKAVRSPKPEVHWRLIMNRLTQADASEEVPAWLARCHEGKAATYVRDELRQIPTEQRTLEKLFWFSTELARNPHFRHGDIFIEATGEGDWNALKIALETFMSSTGGDAKLKQTLWLKTVLPGHEGEAPPMSLWVFHDVLPSACFGRLLIPVSKDHHALNDDLILLNRFASGKADAGESGEQDQLWRYHSAPLTLDHALELMRDRGITFDRTIREFAPSDLALWVKICK